MDAQLVTGVLALALLTISPGADMALVAKVALRDGRRAAFLTTLGICSGLPLHATASALGIAALLAASTAAFTAAKLAGAAYLIWLGVQAFRHSSPAAGEGAATDEVPGGRAPSAAWSFAQGFLSNALNPKVALFYLAFLPQFMRPGDSVLARSLLFAGIHALQGVLWLTAYAYALNRLGRLFRRPSVRTWLERTSGAVLVALGVRLAFERR
jgi:threonine/homoserine/homoserine lactone efflux protein